MSFQEADSSASAEQCGIIALTFLGLIGLLITEVDIIVAELQQEVMSPVPA